MPARTAGRRRARLAALATALVVVLAGCGGMGGPRTPETITATAGEATVSEAALSETGFTERNRTTRQLADSGTLEVAGDVQMEVNYRIEATTSRAVYGDADGSVFAVYSVPLVEPDDVAATIDPLAGRSVTDVATRAQDTYGRFGELEPVENATVTMLGTEVTLARYVTTATGPNGSTEVILSVARVRHDGDVVVAVAVVPAPDDEISTVRTLVGGIDH